MGQLEDEVAQRKRFADSLEYQASHDHLTELPNRNVLLTRLTDTLNPDNASGPHPALLMIDLDRFKEINDTFGHYFGDLVLQQIGTRLQPALRSCDLVARLGGDEFAVLLSVDNIDDARAVAQRLLNQMQDPFVVNGQSLYVGASIGIAMGPEHGDTASELLQHADVAMYVAKQGGQGYTVYSADHDHYSPDRLALIADLRDAIDRDQLASTISRRCASPAVASTRWKHCCAGVTPNAASSHPSSSFH